MLARAAKSTNIPYCLSTVGCEIIEDIGAIADENAWFQLYTFADWKMNTDLLKRAKAAGDCCGSEGQGRDHI
ncbi:MAG: alpha-hydroxy-acid oxidizing protein [Salaquimonas sp.]